MINPTGSLTINGITDTELAHILEAKAKHANVFQFNPQQLQNGANQQRQSFYNNAVFTWNSEESMRIVHEIVGYLLNKEEQTKVAGQ